MYKNIGHSFIEDGNLLSKDYFKFDIKRNNTIYEVMRVICGKVIFFEDHLLRLGDAIRSFSIDIGFLDLIKNDITTLIEEHKGLNKNIKIDLYEINKEYHYRLYFVESFYPSKEVYERGVDTTVSHIVRNNPHMKLLDMDYKKLIKEIKGSEFFEVLLANDKGFITEGSRSNLIFVKGNTLYSSPLDEILEGVTLKNVLKMASLRGFEIKFESVHITELEEYDACFLTGTSLGVLPINSIDEINFNSSKNILVLELIEDYNKTVG